MKLKIICLNWYFQRNFDLLWYLKRNINFGMIQLILYCRKLTLGTKICGRRLSVVRECLTQMRYFQLQTRGSALKRAWLNVIKYDPLILLRTSHSKSYIPSFIKRDAYALSDLIWHRQLIAYVLDYFDLKKYT